MQWLVLASGLLGLLGAVILGRAGLVARGKWRLITQTPTTAIDKLVLDSEANREFLDAGVGPHVLGIVVVFVIILAIGLLYDIKKGGLEFD